MKVHIFRIFSIFNNHRWQKAKNPGSSTPGDLTGDWQHSDHWDHALLLTGLDLYDVRPEQVSSHWRRPGHVTSDLLSDWSRTA